MSRRIIKSRITDYRPPSAGAPSPLDRSSAGPMAAASLHEIMLAGTSDLLIAGVIADAEKRNLRNYGDHEVRWWAERSAVARSLRRQRKAAGTWSIEKTQPSAA